MKNKRCAIMICLCFCLALNVVAGTLTIVNLPAAGTDAVIDISTAKTYTHAFDFGSATGSPVTINGVAFDQGPTAGLTAAYTGTSRWGYGYTIADTRTTTNIPVHAGDVNAASQADGQSAELLKDMIYHGSSTTIGAGLTITLSNLTPSTLYSARIYYRRWGTSDTSSRTITIQADGGSHGVFNDTLNVEWDGGGAHYVDYTFTSDDTDVMLKFLTNDNNAGIHMYGLSNEIGNTKTAWDPDPVNGQGLGTSGPLAIGVPVGAVLSWASPNDPNIDPGYTTQYAVYMDPNQTNVDTGTGCQYTRAMNTAVSFDPASDMAYETQYYWRVDTKVKFNYKEDPNTFKGQIWTFKTISEKPDIVTQPSSTKVNAGQTAQFMAAYTSESPVSVTWFKDSVALNPLTDPNLTIETNDANSVLSIANVAAKYEGTYYCDVTNAGGTVSSGNASLILKRVLAWYQFENNGNDSAGSNHGTEINGMNYTTDVIVKTDGQLKAADPNGANYIALPQATAYPRTGLGNGLDQGTIACWVKCAAGQAGDIMGQYTGAAGTYTTALRFYVESGSGRARLHLRDEEIDQVQPTGAKVDDGQWHYVVVTIDGTTAKIYVDVTNVVSGSDAELGNYRAWEYDMPIMAQNGRGTLNSYFAGDLDDLVITNYPMTQQEIAQAYYNVSGRGSCLQSYASTYDFDGNCKVDLADFAMLTGEWLTCGLFPDCQ